ncbi:hypothetical protein AS594_39335 [Streptomyces agglomeratus]|uniref:Uncharacterized protein n=1 Tax=Streptomyces agglomeratus TaxID=285458 RepID=A0A1E5NZK4_9ACTN|nr:hypothetical protein [Streptomyces agglomeratus]OEJ21737.1 hypothetical protein AS594_39335 [Streptomyces agglomeratus]
MLDQALVVLASAFGAAVASAAGTEVWSGFRDRAALLFGRRDAREAQVVLERLDRSALELDRADPGGADQVRTRLEASWQARCEDLLESLGEADREEAAGQLRELVARQAAGAVTAGDDGIAIGGNADIKADRGSAAALRMGDVTLQNPPMPGPEQR